MPGEVVAYWILLNTKETALWEQGTGKDTLEKSGEKVSTLLKSETSETAC